MKSLCGGLVLMLVWATCAAGEDPGNWMDAWGGAIPPKAYPHGKEQSPDNRDLYVCAAEFAARNREPGLHPGKLRPGFSGCHIGYGGMEYEVNRYKVLVRHVTWVAAAGGDVPPNALVGGREGKHDGGQQLYVCRAQYPPGTAGLHPGKVRREFPGCLIAWGGLQKHVRRYQVAVTGRYDKLEADAVPTR